MGSLRDLTGQQFTYLTVLKRSENRYSSSGRPKVMWKCQCKCGTIKDISSHDLVTGSAKSCGCYNLEKQHSPKQYNRKKNQYDTESFDYVVGYDKNNNQFIIDRDDYGKVSQFCWHQHHGYFEAKDIRNSCKNIIYLHRLILDCELDGHNFEVDHINGDKSDNRKSNLRKLTKQENIINRKPPKNRDIAGVQWHKRDEVWEVWISYNKQTHYLGRTKDYNEAVRIRYEAEQKLHGEYGYCKSRNISLDDIINTTQNIQSENNKGSELS